MRIVENKVNLFDRLKNTIKFIIYIERVYKSIINISLLKNPFDSPCKVSNFLEWKKIKFVEILTLSQIKGVLIHKRYEKNTRMIQSRVLLLKKLLLLKGNNY